MALLELFLATASDVIKSCRERLRSLLSRPAAKVKAREDFITAGGEPLEMLDRCLQGCAGVIRLVGEMTGAMAKGEAIAKGEAMAAQKRLATILVRSCGDGASAAADRLGLALLALEGGGIAIGVRVNAALQRSAPKRLRLRLPLDH
ncbi:MAG: hypothetical protein RLZZ117_85 [Cyanobacteriota bacterium]|jgi:hypothetical protein